MAVGKDKEVKIFVRECLEESLKSQENSSNKFKCKSSKISYISWLQKFESDKYALYCLASQLQEDGTAKEQQDQYFVFLTKLIKSKSCLKKLSKILKNKKTQLSSKWLFLGPFQIGKLELDAQPFSTKGTLENRWNKNFIAYSELVAKGVVKWETIDTVNSDMIQLNPKVNWNDLVMSMQSMAMTEWQGVLINDFAVFNKDKHFLVKCLGTSYFFIDNVLINGDVYHQNIFW